MSSIHTDFNFQFEYLVDTLEGIRDFLKVNKEFLSEDKEDLFSDIRLRYFQGIFEIFWGDSSFDTDHRGSWGCGTITPYLTRLELEELLNSLYLEVEEIECLIV